MDTQTFEKLIQDKPPSVKADGVLLFNGLVKCRAAYQEDPTSSRKRDWDLADDALKRFVIGLDGGDKLANIAHVLEHLKETGWKITKTSLYRHQAEGKLLPAADGTYEKKDVERYARAFLKQQSTGKRLSERTDELQRKKLERELRNLDLEYDRKKFAHDRDLGKFIARESMEMEMAARAGILEAGLKHWIQSHVAEWIRAVGGDVKNTGEQINTMIRDLNEHINRYATSKEFEVIFEGEEHDEGL